MIILDKTISVNQISTTDLEYYKHYYSNEKSLFFDIETTGFVAKNTTLYLIGAMWFDEKQIYIRQWFNDTGYDEKVVLSNFISFCSAYTTLIHFNGLTFDLPYLKKKAEVYDLEFNLDTNLYQIDILKELRPYKNLLGLDNLKQKTIEQYLGIQREDTYTGGELIKVYQEYVANPNREKEHFLLLHNYEDMLGMLSLSKMLNYKVFFDQLTIQDINIDHINIQNEKLQVEYNFPEFSNLPKRFNFTLNHIYINANENKAIIQIPIIEAELKHYFKDFKNYYYLPNEDIAIHKSVASYVDSSNRTKATKYNCYTKQYSKYIPTVYTEGLTIFMDTIDSKEKYTELDILANDTVLLKKYIINFHNQLSKTH